MRTLLAALALASGLGGALAPGLGGALAQSPRAQSPLAQSPFPPTPRAPQFLEVLTPPDFLDRAAIESFEKQTGLTVALDAYANAADLTALGAERRYDLVILRGPTLARRLGGLARLDRRKLPNARYVQPLLTAKFALYDHDGARSVPFGWSAFGLLYDSDKLPTPPVSWLQIFGTTLARRYGDCGIVWPDARELSFLAAWKLINLDPARARTVDVKNAAALLDRARGGYAGFAVPDEVGALAKGSACLGAGSAGEAAAVAARGFDNPPSVRFAYPREGAPMIMYAFAIPENAPSPDAAYRLLDALLDPDNARRDAASAGVNSAEEATDAETQRRLTPEPMFDTATTAAMQSEWKRLTAAK